MRKIISIAVLFSFLFWMSKAAVAAGDTCLPELPCEEETSDIEPLFHGERVCVFYFYGAGCKACAETTPFIEELINQRSTEVEIKKIEIYYDDEMRELFYDFVDRYGGERAEAGVPAVFLGDTYLAGAAAIFDHFEGKLDYFIGNLPEVCPLDFQRIEGSVEPPQELSLTLPAVILAAGVDSINPCALSVLIFLLAYLLAIKAPRRILKVGLAYSFSVFLAYLLAGLGLLRVVQLVGIADWVTWVASGVAILAGLINMKDFFWPDRGFSLKIPESKKPVIERWAKRASVPAAIVLGLLVAAFELPCTGGVYLAILSLLAKNTSGLLAFGYLALYNLIFVLPLLLIVVVVYRGGSPKLLENLRVQHRRLIRLIMGMFMLLLGLGLALGWF